MTAPAVSDILGATYLGSFAGTKLAPLVEASVVRLDYLPGETSQQRGDRLLDAYRRGRLDVA